MSRGKEKRLDLLQNYEQEIEAVSTEDMDRVITVYLAADRRIDIQSLPTTSYAVFSGFIGSLLLIIALVAAYRLRKARKQKKSIMPVYIRS